MHLAKIVIKKLMSFCVHNDSFTLQAEQAAAGVAHKQERVVRKEVLEIGPEGRSKNTFVAFDTASSSSEPVTHSATDANLGLCGV